MVSLSNHRFRENPEFSNIDKDRIKPDEGFGHFLRFYQKRREVSVAAELDRYRNYGQRIEALIRPATFPLAVKRITSEAELKPGYKRPSQDMGVQNFVCQNFKGYLFMEGGVLEFSAAGRIGSCHEGVTKTIKTGKP
jgi:hypothetical protein